MTETTPLSGKKTWSSGLSTSTRICSRRQGRCSRCNVSFLRSRGGKASKSRLRGNLDKTFILSTRSRVCAGSKRKRGSRRLISQARIEMWMRCNKKSERMAKVANGTRRIETGKRHARSSSRNRIMGGCKVGPGESSDPHLVQPLPGHDTRALQAWLGHKNILHTVRYTE